MAMDCTYEIYCIGTELIHTHSNCIEHITLEVYTCLQAELSWPGRITHTEQGRALCVLERALPTELLNTECSALLRMSDSARPAELPQLVEPSLEHRVLCLALYE